MLKTLETDIVVRLWTVYWGSSICCFCAVDEGHETQSKVAKTLLNKFIFQNYSKVQEHPDNLVQLCYYINADESELQWGIWCYLVAIILLLPIKLIPEYIRHYLDTSFVLGIDVFLEVLPPGRNCYFLAISVISWQASLLIVWFMDILFDVDI